MPSPCLCQPVQAHRHYCLQNSHHQRRPGSCGRFGDSENTITICSYCGEFLFLHLRYRQAEDIVWNALSIVSGSVCLLCFKRLFCLSRSIVDFESCMVLLHKFVYLFIPNTSLRSPLVVLGRPQTSVATSSWSSFIFDQAGSSNLQNQYLHHWSQQLQLQQALLPCYLEGQLALASSSCFPELPDADARPGIAFPRVGDVSCEIAHYQVMLLDALLVRDDFHIADCVAETLAIKHVAVLNGRRSYMWLDESPFSWTRCHQRVDHWLWQIPRLSHLLLYYALPAWYNAEYTRFRSVLFCSILFYNESTSVHDLVDLISAVFSLIIWSVRYRTQILIINDIM